MRGRGPVRFNSLGSDSNLTQDSPAETASAVIESLSALVSEHRNVKPLSLPELLERLQPIADKVEAAIKKDEPLHSTARVKERGDLTKLLKPQLQTILSELGLPVSGRKVELVDRLCAYHQRPSGGHLQVGLSPVGDEFIDGEFSSLRTELELLHRFEGQGPQNGIFTDGSCSPNPGPGGWGAVAVKDGKVLWSGKGTSPSTTNNRMELTAIMRALSRMPLDEPMTIWSDSDLCVKTLNQWAFSWEAKGWKKSNGQPPENLDLVQEAHRLLAARPLAKICWLKAHDGLIWNEYADLLSSSWMANNY